MGSVGIRGIYASGGGYANLVGNPKKQWAGSNIKCSLQLKNQKMTRINFSLIFIFIGIQVSYSQNSSTEEEIKDLSKAKWHWMADKDVDKLSVLFHDKSKFVHMSGTWNKNRELEIIESGSIWYKQADVHDVAVDVFDNTAVLWNRITLIAHVRGNDVSNEFTVTEVYKKEEGEWKLLDLTFSKVKDTHKIEPSVTVEDQIIELSKQKWQWMADKNVQKLDKLFHENSIYVHMGGTWGKDREIQIIESGGIHYKKADIHEVSVNMIGNTAVLLNRITLLAVVGGNEVTNPFMVTEVYKQQHGEWKLASLSFTKLLERN